MGCEQWLRFLQESISDDGQRVALRAWMKRALSPNDRPDQALLIVGSGLGKSTFARILAGLAPGGQVSTINDFTRKSVCSRAYPEVENYGINICEIDQIGMIRTPSTLKALIDGDYLRGPGLPKISLVFICSQAPPFLDEAYSRRFLAVLFNNDPVASCRSVVARLLAEKEDILKWAQGA